jgi:hypothetical protein
MFLILINDIPVPTSELKAAVSRHFFPAAAYVFIGSYLVHWACV